MIVVGIRITASKCVCMYVYTVCMYVCMKESDVLFLFNRFTAEDEHVGAYSSPLSNKLKQRLFDIYAPHNEVRVPCTKCKVIYVCIWANLHVSWCIRSCNNI